MGQSSSLIVKERLSSLRLVERLVSKLLVLEQLPDAIKALQKIDPP